MGDAAADLTALYNEAFGVDVDNFQVTPPDAPGIPAPVSLGQTIALDLQTSWWKGWWQRRKGYRAFAAEFYELIEAETAPIVSDLKERQLNEIRDTALGNMATAQKEREELFDIISEELALDDFDVDDTDALTTGGAAA